MDAALLHQFRFFFGFETNYQLNCSKRLLRLRRAGFRYDSASARGAKIRRAREKIKKKKKVKIQNSKAVSDARQKKCRPKNNVYNLFITRVPIKQLYRVQTLEHWLARRQLYKPLLIATRYIQFGRYLCSNEVFYGQRSIIFNVNINYTSSVYIK